MNFNMLLRSALICLKSNKRRVIMTMIGIIIGISTEVIILSIGAGLQENVSKSMNNTEVNSLNIQFQSKNINMDKFSECFSKNDFEKLKIIDGVVDVDMDDGGIMGLSSLGGQAIYFDKSTYLILQEYKNKPLNLAIGRNIIEEDNSFNNHVVVITEQHAKELFGDDYEDGLGKAIKLNNIYLQVIGITKESLGNPLEFNSDYIPSSIKEELKTSNDIYSIKVKIKEGYSLDDVFKEIKEELQRLHPDVNGEYVRVDPQAIVKVFQSIISGITVFIALVSSISLFVSGVGVMNIMYVSVTERKREIGIRRAIGVKSRIILAQFLIESILITLLAGIIGIIIGYGLSKVIGMVSPLKPIFTFRIFLGASTTAILIGILFGIIPALNAAKLDPIRAIYN